MNDASANRSDQTNDNLPIEKTRADLKDPARPCEAGEAATVPRAEYQGDPGEPIEFLDGGTVSYPPSGGSGAGKTRSGPEPTIGTFGDYDLIEILAHGGMGVVYRAWHSKLNRLVALKMIRAGQFASPEEVQRFYVEARAAAHLDHPGIVPVYDVGEHDGQHYYAMGLVEGGSLLKRIRNRPLPPREAAEIMRQVAEAVTYAHQKGIIHRDLKPGNVLLDKDGQPKVTDFGLAKMVEGDSHLTLTGQVLGTPAYMPPEQAAGKSLQVGPTADVYSLGATLYALLTGRPPFHAASTMETLQQVLHQEPVSPRRLNRAVDRDLETICLKCLQKEPAKRYASATALAADLSLWLAGAPIQARPVSRAERLWRWCRRNPVVSVLAGVLVLSLLAGTAVSLTFAIRAQNEAALAHQARQVSEGRLYLAEIQLAHQAWKDGQITMAQERLQRLWPAANADWPTSMTASSDLRGFEWHYLQRLCQPEFRTLRGHDGLVWTISFSPDGRWLVSGGQDSIVRVWDTASGVEVRKLSRHKAPVRSVAFSPCGRWLASASEDRTVILWNAKTGEAVHTLSAQPVPIWSLTFSPDGQRLTTACRRGLCTWDVDTGKPIHSWQHDQGSVLGVAYSPDGKRLASAGRNGTIKVWDAATRQELYCKSGHGDLVNSVTFSNDGRLLASASRDQSVIVRNAATGEVLWTQHGHAKILRSVAFSPDGQRLATAGDDQIVKLWDATTGRPVLTLRGHRAAVLHVTFSPDGWRLASADAEGTIKFWRATASPEVDSLPVGVQKVLAVTCSGDGRHLAAAADRMVKIWDLRTGLETQTLYGHTQSVWSLALSPDARQLVSLGTGRDQAGNPLPSELKLWDLASGKELPFPGDRPTLALAVAFHPDRRRLAAAGRENVVRTWDLSTGQETLTFHGFVGPVNAIAFSPDGRLLAAAVEDGTVHIWEAGSGRETVVLRGHSQATDKLAFSRDGRWLATASRDAAARVWDVATGREILTLRGHRDAVRSVAFSPDARRLATASVTEGIKVWDLLTGQEALSLGQPGDFSYDVAFTPDGERLMAATARREGSKGASSVHAEVLIWDARPLTPDLLLQREARSLVGFLFRKPMLRAEVLRTIQDQGTISNKVRDHALALAEHYPEDAEGFHAVARSVVGHPGAAANRYRLALQQAETACRLAPENGEYLTTRGMAQYRLGEYQLALETLTAADRLSAVPPAARSAATLAFLAMTQHRLALQGQAQATLDRLREQMGEPPWADDEAARAWRQEAEIQLQATVKQPGR
jgi:WD40 repeat protein